MRSFCGKRPVRTGKILLMSDVRAVNSRTLTVVLSESDWRALRAVEPDAVGWLHGQIRERIGLTPPRHGDEAGRPAVPAPVSPWNEDLY